MLPAKKVNILLSLCSPKTPQYPLHWTQRKLRLPPNTPESASKYVKKAHFRPNFSHLREEFAESAKSYPQLYPCDPQLYRPESQLCRSYAVFIPNLPDKKTGRIV
jgi:hypothetical protein